MRIDGSTFVLTGASGGLGAAIASELAGRGAKLTLTARRVKELERLAEELTAETETEAEVVVADLCDDEDLDRLCESVGDADILVANAGMGDDSTISEMTTAEVDRIIGVNLRSPILLATAFVRAHLENGTAGQIVFIGSLAGITASPNTRMYNATKFGLRGFALSLRQELEDTDIGVSIVAPGFIRDAGMFAESAMKLPSIVRLKSPEDVARGVVKAIESNPVEVFVAPPELRMAAGLGSIAPGISARVQSLAGASQITERRSS